jgi:DNA adenine methylase
MIYYTPLRYPGGKAKLGPFIRSILSTNDLQDSEYIEPYAGGAGIGFELLMLEFARRIHLNDLDKAVYGFWQAVLTQTEELCKKIIDIPVNISQWQKQKEVQRNPGRHTALELGFSFFFLNRTNRSGILNGGVIGGQKQTGHWKIDARYHKKELTQRIEKIAGYRNRISICNMDAAQFIRKKIVQLPKQGLVYLDPPYYLKGNRLYRNHYKHADHAKIADLIRSQIEQYWIVSYDNTPEIRSLYRGCRTATYGLNYSANKAYVGSEVMFFCDRLRIDQKSIAKLRGISSPSKPTPPRKA